MSVGISAIINGPLGHFFPIVDHFEILQGIMEQEGAAKVLCVRFARPLKLTVRIRKMQYAPEQ